jgi:peroxiredoxin
MGISSMLAGDVPKEGEEAPDFTAADTEGHSWTLSEMVKAGPAILAFFPKAFTPG